jgi:hypothetical protein
MLSGIYAEWHLCSVAFMLSGIYAQWHLCSVAFMLSGIYAECLSALKINGILLSVMVPLAIPTNITLT